MLITSILAVLWADRCPGQSQPTAPAAPAGKGEEEPSDSAVARLRAMKDAMVLVAVRFNGEVYAVPGVVFHRHGDQALVAARRFEELQKAYSRSEKIVGGPDYVVLWGQGSQRKAVRCQRVSAFERNTYCVVSAPADRLPPPIPLDVAPEPTEQMPVYVIGYETDRHVRPPAYADFAEKGIVRQVNRDQEGQVTTIDIQCTEAPTMSYAVVASTSGQVVGFCLGRPSRGATDESQYVVAPAIYLAKLLEPQITFFQFGFESGDTKQVVYEFVAVLNDPCQQITTPRLSIQRQSEKGPLVEHNGRPIARPGQRLPVEEPPPIDTLPDAKTLDLTKQAPSKAFKLQYPSIERHGDGHTRVARFPAANPGRQHEYVFRGQLSYMDKSGTEVYMPPRRLEFSIRHRKGDAVPAIPGIDGKPIDCYVYVHGFESLLEFDAHNAGVRRILRRRADHRKLSAVEHCDGWIVFGDVLDRRILLDPLQGEEEQDD
jgi:hypothetical protein